MIELVGRLLGRDGVFRVLVDSERVVGIEPEPGDCADLIVPGLVDLQVNGWHGVDVNADDVDADTIERLARSLWTLGVSRFCPTVVTGPAERIEAGLRAVADVRRRSPLLAHSVLGAHLEGPLLAVENGPRGAHDLAWVSAARAEDIVPWISQDWLRILTLAPERAGAIGLIERAARAGIVVAIGHTAADPAVIGAAAATGARLSTHLGNGAHAVLPRHPNYLWAQLADDRLAASFIADGHHLDAATFRAMVRAKGVRRAILVSDSVALGGLPPGEYYSPVGGAVVLERSGALRLAGSTLLAGAARSLLDGVNWAARSGGISLTDAVTMATATPGRLLGLTGHTHVEVGVTSDLAVLRPTADGWHAVATVVAGQLVHAAG